MEQQHRRELFQQADISREELSNVTKLIILLVLPLLLNSCPGDAGRASVSVESLPAPVVFGPESVPHIKSADFQGSGAAWVLPLGRNLLHTVNGGRDWLPLAPEDSKKFACLSFIDSERGWAVDEQGQTWRTEDAGRAWSLVSRPPDAGGLTISSPEQLRYFDSLHGWLRDSFTVWRTEDGGVTWAPSLIMTRHRSKLLQPTHASFLSETVAFVSCSGGVVRRTTDGGNTWHTQVVGDGEADMRLVQFLDEKVGWVYSGDGGIYHSRDGGITWQRQTLSDKHTNINSFHFVDSNEGWAAGWQSGNAGNGSGPVSLRGVLLHTVNGGRDWQTEDLNLNETTYDDIYFTGAEQGWLVGHAKVYRTLDGGKSWSLSLSVNN